MKRTLLVCSILLIVASCASNGSSVYVKTESLVSASSEKVSFPITDSSSVDAIADWIHEGDNKPSSAEISCLEKDTSCLVVKRILKKSKITYTVVPSKSEDAKIGNITIMYNKILARDCETADFGCSTSINSLRMVTNREQFTKPAISDFQDAASAVRAVDAKLK